MKKLLSFLFFVFMASAAAMAQEDDICNVIDSVLAEAKQSLDKGEMLRAQNLLHVAMKSDALQELNCSSYPRLAEEASRIENYMQNFTFTVNGVTFTMVYVMGGTFTMGATPEQGNEDYVSETPHRVYLTDYYIGETEVTQALWQAVMGNNPSKWKDPNMPVEMVSWNDCQQFISKLNEATEGQRPNDRKFSLPTEAQWEFAARGGSKSGGYRYSGSNDVDSVAWHEGNSRSTHPVKQKNPNELGLYDMCGNVREWCLDFFDQFYFRKFLSVTTNPCNDNPSSSRVRRNGAYCDAPKFCRIAERNGNEPNFSGNFLGLRLAL